LAAKDEAGKAAQRLLDQARREGRQVLVVVGAGCSFAAGMPLMSDVYRYLNDAVRKRVETTNKPPRLLSELGTWLSSLAGTDPSPRSVAARALGLLQQAHTGGGLELEFGVPGLAKELDQIWLTFARDFLAGEVTPPARRKAQHKTILHYPTTELHRRIAQWVCEDTAIALSLNFDGLTRVAIDDRIGPAGGSGVILTNPEQIDKYFLAEESDIKQPTRAVIKVWGDVFHATCRNARCPAFDTPVGLYDLRTFSPADKRKTSNTTPKSGGLEAGRARGQRGRGHLLAREGSVQQRDHRESAAAAHGGCSWCAARAGPAVAAGHRTPARVPGQFAGAGTLVRWFTGGRTRAGGRRGRTM